MRNKTSKLRKLESERFSIITEDLTKCVVCGASPVDIHEVYGGCNRLISMRNGLCLPLCRYHHRIVTDVHEEDFRLKQIMQEYFEQNHTREDFIKLIGKSYL